MISLIGETKKNNAFTLVEILLVIIITGIVLALAAPNFSKGYSSFQLNKTAEDLLSLSRWAQAMSMGQERIYALSFTGDYRSYELLRVKSGDDESDKQDNFEPVQGTLGRMHAIPQTIHLVMRTQSYDSKGDYIEFYPDGTIDPATIQLSTAEKKEILSSSEVRGMMMKVNGE
jgi:prepilin-type N-terminal cleavage/methylation domain-containing protein